MNVLSIDTILGRSAKYPFKIENGTWELTKKGKVGQQRHVKDSLTDLIFTILGERVFRRDYGSLAMEYVFESIDEIHASALENSILESLEKYEGKVDIIEINAIPDTDNSRYVVNIKYEFAGDIRPSNIVVPISAENFNISSNL